MIPKTSVLGATAPQLGSSGPRGHSSREPWKGSQEDRTPAHISACAIPLMFVCYDSCKHKAAVDGNEAVRQALDENVIKFFFEEESQGSSLCN